MKIPHFLHKIFTHNYYDENLSVLDKALIACKKSFLYAVILGACANILILILPIYSMQVLDRVIASFNLQTLFMLTIVTVIVLSVLNIIQTIRGRMLYHIGLWIENKVQAELVEISIFYALDSRKNALSRLLRDIYDIKMFISNGLSSFIDFPWAIFFICILYMIAPMNAFITLVGAVVMLLCALYSDKISKKLVERSKDYNLRRNNILDSIVRSSDSIIAMSMIGYIRRFLHVYKSTQTQAQDLNNDIIIAIQNIGKFTRMLIQLFVICSSAYLVITGKLTTGSIIASSILSGRALAPFELTLSSYKNFILARQSYIRIEKFAQRYLKYKKIPQNDGVGHENNVLREGPGHGMAEFEHDRNNGRNNDQKDDAKNLDKYIDNEYIIHVKNVTFRYNVKNVIQDISYSFKAGKIVAITGRSGSGKTTLCRVITGILRPYEGSVNIYGTDPYQFIRQINISKTPSPSRTSHAGGFIGYLSQENGLIATNIASNISQMEFAEPNERIINIAKLLDIHDEIMEFKSNYYSKITDNMLSPGQRQKIGIARAIFNDPKILVLDEPTSSLDKKTKDIVLKLMQDFRNAMKVVIVVTHDDEMLGMADEVITL